MNPCSVNFFFQQRINFSVGLCEEDWVLTVGQTLQILNIQVLSTKFVSEKVRKFLPYARQNFS